MFYPRPAERQESSLIPVCSAHKEESRDHHEDPHHQVDDVQDVVEAHRVLHPQSHNHRDQDGDDQGQEVWVRLLTFTWGERIGVTVNGQLTRAAFTHEL